MHDGRVERGAGIGHEYILTRIDQCRQAQLDRLAGSGGHEHRAHVPDPFLAGLTLESLLGGLDTDGGGVAVELVEHGPVHGVDHVDGQTHRPALVGDRTADRVPDPPCPVG